MPNYLCIDYGEKHVGLAVATTFVAQELETIPTQLIMSRLKEICLEYDITDVVIGLSEQKMGEMTKAFAALVATEFRLPIHFHDETLTSQDTRKHLAQMGAKRKTREAKIDHYVAAAILQDFLDSK